MSETNKVSYLPHYRTVNFRFIDPSYMRIKPKNKKFCIGKYKNKSIIYLFYILL